MKYLHSVACKGIWLTTFCKKVEGRAPQYPLKYKGGRVTW